MSCRAKSPVSCRAKSPVSCRAKSRHLSALALVIAGLTVNLLAGCAASEIREEPREVTLRPVTSLQRGDLYDDSGDEAPATEAARADTFTPATKADPELDGNTLVKLPPSTDPTYPINPYVVYVSASSVQHPLFLSDQLFSYIHAGNVWESSSANGTADPIYWPVPETLDFLGLACKPEARTALGASIEWDSTTAANGFTITDWDVYEQQYDIMYGAANNKRQSDNAGIVDMEFLHSCALVCFTAKSTVAGVVTIHGITLNGLGYKGTFTVDNTRTDLVGSFGTLTAGDKVVYGLDGTNADYNFAVPATATKFTQNLLVPQQPAKSITLSYTTPGVPVPLDLQIHIPRTNWKAGYKYTYALDFTMHEIKLTEEVSDWPTDPDHEITL